MRAHWAYGEQEHGSKCGGTYHSGQEVFLSQLCGGEAIFTNGEFIQAASVGQRTELLRTCEAK